MSPRPPFAIASGRVGPTAVVEVSGDIDMQSAAEFEAALAGVMAESDAAGLLVDLSRVAFIDSTGLNALVRAFERHRISGHDFALVSDDRRVAIMLEVSRLDQVLDRFRTRDQALAAMAARG